MNLLRQFSSTIRFNHLILSPFYRQTHLKSSTSERVPEWSQPENESIDIKRRRLLYQSRKRGMLENDLLISNFASIYLPKMNEKDLDIYDKLINTPSNDWDLYYMAIGKMETPPEYQNHIMDLFKEYVKNDKKQARLRQPDLVPV